MKIFTYTVRPNMPEALKPLEEIAMNVWFGWNFDAARLFIRLDYDAWIASSQNPARALGLVSQARLDEMANDDSFIAALKNTYAAYKEYRTMDTWYNGPKNKTLAYFSMEYGLDASLPIYSGGLGILSGDHMKASSDLGIPLVGIGLLYRRGYFKQYLNADGFQQEAYPENDCYSMPIHLCTDKKGNPLHINVEIGDSLVVAQIWKVIVGRNPLYLLDTDIEENTENNREITACLYGGDKEMRIRQEILLGIGGIHALRALGIEAVVTHMNEGHSAFLAIERIRVLMHEKGLSFYEACEAVKPTNIFTTHTPVPAGNERFSMHLMDKYFRRQIQEMGIKWEEFLSMGRVNPHDHSEMFCMTVFALKLASYANGVSKLHGVVSREMWKDIWPGLPLDEIPIGHITNGVHPQTWINHSVKELLSRYLGSDFELNPANREFWDRINHISDEEMWRAHERRQERLVVIARKRLRDQLISRGAPAKQVAYAEEVLSPNVLTISFARRFATYKRATLLLRDKERLIRLLSDKERPLQLVFAGKAHPHDIPGKELIKSLIHFARIPEVRNRVVFLENYDMYIAEYMLSGSDVWLNNPRRPLEASGTSGMKAAMNGALNLSVLDGWWEEAYEQEIGWAIGHGEEYDDPDLQDEIESKALYDLIEYEIIPLYYDRGRDGLPREWIHKMKKAIQKVGKQFSSHRMLMDYTNKFYIPAFKNHDEISKENYAQIRDVSAYIERLKKGWDKIKFLDVDSTRQSLLEVGQKLSFNAVLESESILPEEICVELFYGSMGLYGQFSDQQRIEMTLQKKDKTTYSYKAEVECQKAGRMGFAVRVIPKHPVLVSPFLPGFIKWKE